MLTDVLKRLTPYGGQQEFTGDVDTQMARMSQDMMRARREASLERCQQLDAQRKLDEQQDEDLAIVVRAAVVAGAIDQPVEHVAAPVNSAKRFQLALGRGEFRQLVERAETNDAAAREELKRVLRRHRRIWQELAAMVKTIQARLLDKIIGRGNELRQDASQLLEQGRSQLRRHPGNAVERLALERVMLSQAQIWALSLCYSSAGQLSREEAQAVAGAMESAANRRQSALESLATVHEALSEAKLKTRRKRFVIRRTPKTA